MSVIYSLCYTLILNLLTYAIVILSMILPYIQFSVSIRNVQLCFQIMSFLNYLDFEISAKSGDCFFFFFLLLISATKAYNISLLHL